MKLPKEPPSSGVTPESLYLRRREFIKNAALFAGTTTALGGALLYLAGGGRADSPETPSQDRGIGGATPPHPGSAGKAPRAPNPGPLRTPPPLTPLKDPTTPHNFFPVWGCTTHPHATA